MNILGIGAHFDDLELGCSGTLMKHVHNGDKVYMLTITDSGYKDPNGKEVRAIEIAQQEGQNAAKIIGGELICLDYPTFMVPFNEELTKTLDKYIEDLKIDTVYSHWIGDVHRDHQAAGRCALMAGRHVPRFLMYRSNFYDSDRQFTANFYSDISDFMDLKIKVISAHKSELERVRYQWLDFFKNQNSNEGQKIGVNYAECFEVVRFLI